MSESERSSQSKSSGRSGRPQRHQRPAPRGSWRLGRRHEGGAHSGGVPQAAASRPRRRRVRYGAALLALLAVVGYVTFRTVTGAATVCTVEAAGDTLTLLPQQAANASTIGAVASSRDLPERALAIALATSMQESGLRNLRDGDRDSLGLFQQRPSQGWGTADQIMDPVYSANEFFDELVKIPGYARLPVTVAAQRVQHSGYPQAYAKRAADASLLASALSGRMPSLSCRVTGDGGAGDPVAVRTQLAREFGEQVLPQEGTPDPSADGGAPDRTVTVPAVEPADSADSASRKAPGRGTTHRRAAGQDARDRGSARQNATDDSASATRHGWVLAQWAVAHAEDLRIAEVAFEGRVWRAAHSGKGWVLDPGTGLAGTTDESGASGQAYGVVRITVAP